MKTTWKCFSIILLLSLTTITYYSCSKKGSGSQEIPAGKQNLSLYLTDDPGFFDKVLIDIKSIAVLTDTCSHGGDWDDNDKHENDDHPESHSHCVNWDSLKIRPGIYDLLKLSNGVDTLLASGLASKGNIKLIKIMLGDSSSVVKDSITYPIHLLPGAKHYVYISLKGDEWEEFEEHHKRLWLDFDIGRSVIKARDGVFYLRPFFHFFTEQATGRIKGQTVPRDAYAVVSVYSNKDTSYAIPNREGRFKIRGLKEGSYDVFVKAANGYKDTTITHVSVKTGKDTDLGTITLHK